MKLAFSTKGWHDRSFDEFCRIAVDHSFQGIELHNIYGQLFTSKSGAFHDAKSGATLRKLYEQHLQLPCIDTIGDLAERNQPEELCREISDCVAIAARLKIPYVRLRTCENTWSPEGEAAVKANLNAVLADAEAAGVTLLIETSGMFCHTDALRSLLEEFAHDCLAALWYVPATVFAGGETADQVIKNLGAYVCHVHLNDACEENGTVVPRLMGEGSVDMSGVMQALRSVNYEGFLSLVWHPDWCEDMRELDMIFAQFVHYMSRFQDPSRHQTNRYFNRTHTGTFLWKKDLLIRRTFSQVLDRLVEDYPDQYAFKYTTLDYTRTYAQFREDVDTFARSLIALGVKKGTHVAVWASNVPQWFIAFWATVKLGAVLVTVNTAYKSQELEYLLKQSDTHTLIMTSGNKDIRYGEIVAGLCPELAGKSPEAALHAKRLPFLRSVITVGFEQEGCLTWEKAVSLAQTVPVDEVRRMAAQVHHDDVCNMQYTSGTTGFPKGVMLTHHNIINNGKCIGDRMDLSTADRMMIQVPMFHCFGMVLAMTAAMTHGATLLPLPYFSPKPALACIHNEHVTAFHGVPTMFISLLSHPDFEKTDFSYMRTGIMAGSPCPIATMQDVVEKMNMKEITIVYGQTEASPGCTMSSTDDPIEVRVTTVGRPLPEIECRIVDPETGEECPDEVPGEFLARGYNLMKGYYKMPAETARAIDEEGWLHTGDLACRTPEGNFRITGRLKDMIIRGGENIYPKEIEEFIYTHPKVSDVQVIGVPDETYGEEIMACVIVKEGQTMTAEELRTFVGNSMARHKIPRYVEFMQAFPMNAAGKILKYKMREDAVKKLGL